MPCLEVFYVKEVKKAYLINYSLFLVIIRATPARTAIAVNFPITAESQFDGGAAGM